MTSFVDTNIFIHYLLGYDPQRFEACHNLLRAAEQGQAELETSAMVFAELVWFLQRPPLRMPPAGIRSQIEPLLRLSHLRLPERGVVSTALELYTISNMNFVDAHNTVLMRKRGITRIYSYDTDFDGVPDVERLEP